MLAICGLTDVLFGRITQVETVPFVDPAPRTTVTGVVDRARWRWSRPPVWKGEAEREGDAPAELVALG